MESRQEAEADSSRGGDRPGLLSSPARSLLGRPDHCVRGAQQELTERSLVGAPESVAKAQWAIKSEGSWATINQQMSQDRPPGQNAGRWPGPQENPTREGNGTRQKNTSRPLSSLRSGEGRTYQQFAELLVVKHLVFVLFCEFLAQGDGLLPHL